MNTSPDFPWKRLWYERGSEPPSDPSGFLYAPDDDRTGRSRSSIAHSTDFVEEKCVIFLGEPSSGKSKAIGNEGSDQAELEAQALESGNLAYWCDLRDVVEPTDLDSQLSGQCNLAAWKANERQRLYLFLDSLDECILSIPEISNVLIRAVRHLPIERLFLRIACRTADWPVFLELELQKLYRQELRVVELAPLRKSEVDDAAQAMAVDVPAFSNMLLELNAVPFARKPSTLIFLLKAFAQRKQVSDSQWGRYEEGCRIRCEEYNTSRIASHKIATFTPDQLLEVACRIAAMTIFTETANIADHAQDAECV